MKREAYKRLIGSFCCLAACVSCEVALADLSHLPDIPDNSGKVITVTGPVAPEALGQTLMHEHVFIAPQPIVSAAVSPMTQQEKQLYNQPLTMANLYQARYGVGVRAMKFITDFDLVNKEVGEFKEWSGGAIVDLTSVGLSRDPRALAHLSRISGLKVVMGSGWYSEEYYPADMDERTVDDLTAALVRDIVSGVDGTGIRSGIIGEIDVDGHQLSRNERKVVRAAARASRLTGAPMSLRYDAIGVGDFNILDAISSEGVELSQVVIEYGGGVDDDLHFIRKLLERGVYVEVGPLGVIGGPHATLKETTDRDKAKWIARLIDEGYIKRILLGQDIHAKFQLKAYGGTGYSYISRYFLPELRRLGVSDQAIYEIMVENPRRVLTFSKPK